MIIIVSLLTTLLVQFSSAFTIVAIASLNNSFTLVPNVAYEINLTFGGAQSISSDSTVVLEFSQKYSIPSTPLSCQASTVNGTAPSQVNCNGAYNSPFYQIIITGVFPTSGTYNFTMLQFTINNPYAKLSESVSISILDSSQSELGSGIVLFDYSASIMSCSIESSSQNTSVNAIHTFTFYNPQMLISGSYLLISLPSWLRNVSVIASSSPTCLGIQGTDLTSLTCNISVPTSGQIMNISNGLISTNKSVSQLKFSIEQVKNPWSLLTFGPITTVLYYNQQITQKCNDIYLQVTTPSPLSNFQIQLLNDLSISGTNPNTRLTFEIGYTNFLGIANMVMIQFSKEVTISYTGNFSKESQNQTQLTLANVSGSLIFNFTVVNPPSTRPFNFKITTYYVQNSIGYAMETLSTDMFQCNPGMIINTAVTPKSIDINAITSYTITFTISHQLVQGSFIVIAFPSQLDVVQPGTCQMVGQSCSVGAANNISIEISSNLSAMSTLTVTVDNILNANEPLKTSSFAIYTYYDQEYDSLVDKVTDGITVNIVSPTIKSASITPTSPITNALTQYEINLTLNKPIPINGSIMIIFPPTVSPSILTSLLSATFSINSCFVSYSAMTNTIKITNCFTTTPMDTLALSLKLSNILNPPSYAQSDSFSIYTYDSIGEILDFITTKLTVTMTVPANTKAFRVTPATLIVGSVTTYFFSITHAILAHSKNDYAVITIPPLMTVPASLSCSNNSGISSISCSTTTGAYLRVIYTGVPSQTISFTLDSMQNYLIAGEPTNYSLSIYDSGDNLMQVYSSFTVKYIQSTFASVTVNNDNNIALNQLSNITLTITNTFALYTELDESKTQLLITIPNGFKIGSSCSSSIGQCLVNNSTTYIIKAPGKQLSSFSVLLSDIGLNSFNPRSPSFSIIYSYDGYNVSVETSGITVGIYCLSPCQRCSSSPNTCMSCLPSPNTLIYYDPESMLCEITCGQNKFSDTNRICQKCTQSCLTCNNTNICFSCISDYWLYQTSCLLQCPTNYYKGTNNICSQCSNPCYVCENKTFCVNCLSYGYFYNNLCFNYSDCPSGTFPNSSTMQCNDCVPPCSQCSKSSTNCTICIDSLVQYKGNCLDSCPSNSYNVSGICVICPNCISCMNGGTCQQCQSNYYIYSGKCYLTCPSDAPIPDDTLFTCTGCSSGLIFNPSSGKCQQQKRQSTTLIYFPFSIIFVFFASIWITSKYLFKKTEIITALAATVSLCQFGSWCLLVFFLNVHTYFTDIQSKILLFVTIAIILLSIGLGVSYDVMFYMRYRSDKKVFTWKENNKCSYRMATVMSFLSFRFFRITYSKLFKLPSFSMFAIKCAQLLSATSKLTFASLIVNTLPMVCVCVFTVYKAQHQYDQTFFCALDTLLLGFLAGIFLITDSINNSKNQLYRTKSNRWELEYRNMKNQDSLSEIRSSDQNSGNKRMARSQVAGEKQKNNIFQQINWVENLNKFGHLDAIHNEVEQCENKSMPDQTKIVQHSNQSISKGDEKASQKQYKYELGAMPSQQDTQHGNQMKKSELDRKKEFQQNSSNRINEQQDSIDVCKLGLVTIDKKDGKFNKSHNKKTNAKINQSEHQKSNNRPIDQKSMKQLQEISKKNDIDPTFMKQTFGTEKHYNPELLNEVIDKKNEVKRESIKQVFSTQSNPEILQELFHKNSKMDPKKFREILNEPQSKALIQKMIGKDKGILSPEMCKQLFEQDGRYSNEFIKNLLSENNGMDHEKLKSILGGSNSKGQQSPLRTLKKVGGQNLQKKQVLNNMLGKEAELKPANFTRVGDELPVLAIQNIFANKLANSNLISSKILNNPKIKLPNLVPILEDEEIVQELVVGLSDGKQDFEENIMNLFKNANNIDPVKLQQMIKNPVIRQKLLSKNVDLTFLQAILEKDSKSDINLLCQTLELLPQESIQQSLKPDPKTDFISVAELFDANQKTDPALVAKMLEPSMRKTVFAKGNDTRKLKKFIQKGNSYDPQVIKNLISQKNNEKQDRKGRSKTQSKDHKFSLNEQINKVGNQKGKKKTNQLSMENLSNSLLMDEIKGVGNSDSQISKNRFKSREKKNHRSQININRAEEMDVGNFQAGIDPVTSQKQDQKMQEWVDHENDEGYENGELPEIEEFKKRKALKKKRKQDHLVNVRHPSEQIYLQRIEAPHETAMRKANMHKKRKVHLPPLQMDEDNDIFDMNF